MGTKTYFTNIEEIIERELDGSRSSITVAIAWLTSPKLFDALVRAASRGVLVRIALQDDNKNRDSGLSMKNLTDAKGQCYWIVKTKGSFHHKFCIIDNNILINGSYNWTNYARLHNDENITVTDGDFESVDVFRQEFEILLKKYGHTVTNLHLKPLEVVSGKLAIPSETEEELEFLRPKRHQRTKRLSRALFFGLWLAIIGIAWLFFVAILKEGLLPSGTKNKTLLTNTAPRSTIEVPPNPNKLAQVNKSKVASSRTRKNTDIISKPECNFKTVMSDDDYRACGINPPE